MDHSLLVINSSVIGRCLQMLLVFPCLLCVNFADLPPLTFGRDRGRIQDNQKFPSATLRMDNRAANRGHSSNKAVRKPLQDTTISANNYSSPTPAHYITKPQSSDYAKDVKQQQHYSHTQERTYSVTPQSKVISGARGRNSHYSTASITTPTPLASRLPKLRKGKAQVGPWLLGRTLGKGSSGRVRLARHFETGQLAAIKIVGKGQQEGHDANGQRQIGGTLPQGLEREVVIMKLISHENVMGLLDVWENRGELSVPFVFRVMGYAGVFLF